MEVMAASRNRMPSTSALPETVDLCADLGLLAREIHDHNRRVVMEGAADWADLAEKLAAAADRCRRQMVITLTDDNSGSR